MTDPNAGYYQMLKGKPVEKHSNKGLILFIQYSKEVETVPAHFARELAEIIIKEREKVAQLEQILNEDTRNESGFIT